METLYLYVWRGISVPSEVKHKEPVPDDIEAVRHGSLKIFKINGQVIEQYDTDQAPEDVWQEVGHQF